MSSPTVGRDVVERLLTVIALPEPSATNASLTDDELEALLPLLRYEGIAGWLSSRIRWPGSAPHAVSRAREALRHESLAQTAHLMRVAATLSEATNIVAGIGYRSVPLKGAAFWRMTEQYPFLTYRRTGDVDLLIEPGGAHAAWDALVAAGFRTISDVPSVHADHHHLPPLRSPLDVAVEVHTSASLFWTPHESWARLFHGAREDTVEGTPLVLPHVTELFWHHFVHCIGNGGGGCRLRDFLTAAALIRGPEPIDWSLIADRFRTDSLRDHDSRHPVPRQGARRWLAMAFALSGTPAPKFLALPADTLPRLVKLVRYRLALLQEPPPLTQDAKERFARRVDEGARAALGLGLGRLPHWLPWWLRPKRLVTSATIRLQYFLTP